MVALGNHILQDRSAIKNIFYGVKDSKGSSLADALGIGASMSSLRITRLVVFNEDNSNPCPCVMASVGQASTQYPQKMQRL